ncbi:MAG TPA: HPr family phosphocarrier protein [Chloroflexota bacterium]
MARVELEIHNEHGLHARPAALFVQTANRFQSRITLQNVGRDEAKPVDAKSIMSVLTAGVHKGSQIALEAEGPDADEAIAALTELVQSGMGEG